MAELLVLVVVVALAITLGLFLFANLGTVLLIFVGLGVLVAVFATGAWLIEAVSSWPTLRRLNESPTRSRAGVRRQGIFYTENGTAYATLRRLALRAPPSDSDIDCRIAEREGRDAHRRGAKNAAQQLLIARALWSARRAHKSKSQE